MNSKTIIFIFLYMLMRLFKCESESINFFTAEEKCKERNGLASYKHLINSERRSKDIDKFLGNEKTVWISGTVLFSDQFVRWYGCFGQPRDGLRKYIFSRNNIYECLSKCPTGTQYIGIENNLCYCISHDDFEDRLTPKNNSDCIHHFISRQAFSNKYKKATISVYTCKASGFFMWKSISDKNLGKCVYYQTNGKNGSYVTGSCYTKEIGYICTNQDNGMLIKNCSKDNKHISYHGRSYCYYSEPSSWISSLKHCKQLSANLIGSLDGGIKIKINQSIGPASFWTGFIRGFNFTEFRHKEFAKEIKSCLSVINMNNNIVLDPVDCSSEKGYICEDDISKIEEKTTHESVENNSLLPTTVEYSHSTNKLPDFFPDYLVIIIPPTIFVPILIVVCIIFRKKIRKQCMCVRQDETRSNDINGVNPNNISINLESLEQSSNPRRQEILNQSINTEVEYDMSGEILATNDVVNSEYDRVNSKLFRQQTRAQSSTATGNDMNEYDVHTGITHGDDTNEYDHLEAHAGKQLKESTDGIYNKIAAENETYNVLKFKDKVDISE